MRTTKRSTCALTVAVTALLTGCGGSGEGLDENGRPVTGEDSPLVPELQSIQDHVFTPVCTVCHAGTSAPLGFRLDAGSSFSMLVNTASVEVPSLKRVLPGNPDQSYLIQKLEGHAAVGAQMPLGGTPLPQATIDVIRQWIANGAQQGAAASGDAPGVGSASADATSVGVASAALQLRATTPLDGEILTQAPREILIQASGELDTTTLHASTPGSSTVTLQRSGGDGTFTDGNETAVPGVTVSVHSLEPTVLALTIPAGQWVPDTYQLTLSGNQNPAVTGRNGLPIDGAGLGFSGSDFVLQFSIEASTK